MESFSDGNSSYLGILLEDHVNIYHLSCFYINTKGLEKFDGIYIKISVCYCCYIRSRDETTYKPEMNSKTCRERVLLTNVGGGARVGAAGPGGPGGPGGP